MAGRGKKANKELRKQWKYEEEDRERKEKKIPLPAELAKEAERIAEEKKKLEDLVEKLGSGKEIVVEDKEPEMYYVKRRPKMGREATHTAAARPRTISRQCETYANTIAWIKKNGFKQNVYVMYRKSDETPHESWCYSDKEGWHINKFVRTGEAWFRQGKVYE